MNEAIGSEILFNALPANVVNSIPVLVNSLAAPNPKLVNACHNPVPTFGKPVAIFLASVLTLCQKLEQDYVS